MNVLRVLESMALMLHWDNARVGDKESEEATGNDPPRLVVCMLGEISVWACVFLCACK